MKVSYQWIKALTGIKQTSRELAETLNRFAFDTELTENPQVLEVKVQSNRVSDVSGHLGFAEEVARVLKTKVRLPKVHYKKSAASAKAKLSVELKEKKLCRRYLAAYVEDLRISSSPQWIQERLLVCGLRPINTVVDILNYVMLEYGQPLHAFDYDKLPTVMGKAQIVVRRSRPGEKITTLENKSYALAGTELLICDAKQALAVAGVKGGKKAEIDKTTKRIVIEAANFEPVSIRLTAKRLGLKTDASWRFENDLDPETARPALERACQLCAEICAGKVAKDLVDVYPQKESSRSLRVSKAEIEKILGVSVPVKELERILATFSSKVRKTAGGFYALTVVSQRRDIHLREDVAEEVMRLYGCDKIPATMPEAAIKVPMRDAAVPLIEFFQDNLVKLGFDETLNYSLVNEKDLKIFRFLPQPVIRVANPASELYTYLRPGMLVGLLRNVSLNLKRQPEVKLFEIGKVFFKQQRGAGKQKDYLPGERLQLELVLAGGTNSQQQIFQLKGYAESLLAQCGLTREDYEFRLASFPSYVPGEVASLVLVKGTKTPVGLIGNLDSKVLRAYGVEVPVSHAELWPEFLPQRSRRFSPFSKYPTIVRDISVFVATTATVKQVEDRVRIAAGRLFQRMEMFDVFEKEGKKSLSFHLVFGSMERTLTDREIDAVMKKINQALVSKGFAIR